MPDLECQSKMPAILPCKLTVLPWLPAKDGDCFATVCHQGRSFVECLLDVVIYAQKLLRLRCHLQQSSWACNTGSKEGIAKRREAKNRLKSWQDSHIPAGFHQTLGAL